MCTLGNSRSNKTRANFSGMVTIGHSVFRTVYFIGRNYQNGKIEFNALKAALNATAETKDSFNFFIVHKLLTDICQQ